MLNLIKEFKLQNLKELQLSFIKLYKCSSARTQTEEKKKKSLGQPNSNACGLWKTSCQHNLSGESFTSQTPQDFLDY